MLRNEENVVRKSPRHALRFALAAVLVGLAWYALLVQCVAGLLPEPWSLHRDPDGLHQVELALSFVLAVLVPAWFFRRAVRSMRTSETFAAAALTLPIVVLCFTTADLSLSLAGGCEEIDAIPDLLGKLAMWAMLVMW